jgi:hypothetical protein
MITITEQPYAIDRNELAINDPKQPPVPVSDCWKWCLQPDSADAVTTPGSFAEVVVTFPSTTSVPADGTPFKIWGYDFTVDSAQDFTANSFKAETSGILTMLNFSSMISANLFFNRATTQSLAIVGSDLELTITWNECREQPRFVVEHMDLSGVEDTGATTSYANGVSPVYVDGYRIITRIGYYQDSTNTFYPISKFVGLQADNQCTGVGAICPQYLRDAETELYTDLPDLTSTSFISAIQGGRSLMKLFSLEYGWVYRTNCQAQSGTIKKSDLVLGINAAFDIDDPFQMRRYWYGHPDGYPDGQFVSDFLTTQPKSIPLCWESFKWLWLLNSWQSDFGQYRLIATFSLYKKGVGYFENFTAIINDPNTMGSSWYQPVNFNVSPQYVLDNAPTLTAADLDYYEVQVAGIEMATTSALFNASEILKFVPGHCCTGTTDVYFLTPAGGIGTVVVRIDEKEVVQDGQEIYLQTVCGTSRADRARYGGRTMMTLRSYEKITFSIQCPPTEEWRRWLKHFRSSPQHWMRVQEEAASNLNLGGDPLAKKLLLEPGTAKIYTSGEGLIFTATGYLQDISTQKGTEP